MFGVHTFVDEGLGHSSYLVDLGDRTAALVDPPRFPDQELATARSRGLDVVWTIDTHSHADYVTGSPSLAAQSGAVFVAPAASELASRHHPIRDGDTLRLAPDVALRAMSTPGHTPDHHAYLIERRGTPLALFSGGSLMVGAVGRTDLCGPDRTVELARHMYRSLRRLDDLPDDLAVYPTHGAGSFCSAAGGSARSTTLGHERTTNRLFRLDDEDEFVERLLSGFGSFPPYFRALPELNRRGPRHYADVPVLDRLDADHVAELVAGGAVVVDVRPFAGFATGHVTGSLSNALRPVFASWLGWLVELGQAIVIVADADQDRDEIVRRCLDVGHDAIAGELASGLDGWRAAGGPIDAIPLVAPDDLAGTVVDVRQANGRAAGGPIDAIPLVAPDDLAGTVVDVRQANEYAAGHVPGAINIELGELAHAALPAGRLTLMCGHGERAMTGASLLSTRRRGDLAVLAGGPDSWSTWSGRPLEVAP